MAKERTKEQEMDRNLRIMMDHAGLADVPIEELGGNHPFHTGPVEIPPPYGTTEPPPKIPPKSKRPDPHKRPPLPAAFPPPPADDPNPVELAIRMQKFMWAKKLNVTELARELGRSRAYVRNHIRLLYMPNTITEHVRTGRLTEAHARTIGKMRDPEAIARLVINRQLSVRQTELIARRLRYIGPDGQLLRDTAIPNSKWAEEILEDALGFKTRIKDRAGRGKIEIYYNSPKEAQALVDVMAKTFAQLHPDDVKGDYAE